MPVRGECDRGAEIVRTVQKVVRSSLIQCARPWNCVYVSKLWAFLEIVRASQNNVPAPRKLCERSCNILFASQKFVTCNCAQDPGYCTHVGKRVLESQKDVRDSQKIVRSFLQIGERSRKFFARYCKLCER
jgi:hypothetical protein